MKTPVARATDLPRARRRVHLARPFGPILGLFAGILPAIATAPKSDPLPDEIQQLVVSVAPTWSSTHGRLQCFERSTEGWHAVSEVMPVLYGSHGLAWGRGVRDDGEAEPRKVEGDGCAPAGVFAVGTIFGYDPALPEGADYPYHQVTAADAWVDDPKNPLYNRHVVVDLQDPPAWFASQQMRQNDPAYRWLVEIRHNADPPVPGAGSAIFLHLQRGPDRATAGCTALTEKDLVWVICWLRASAHPHFMLLPRDAYGRYREAWRLPVLTGPEWDEGARK